LIDFFSDNRERIPLSPDPYISEFDPLRSESNEEFIARLKNMGKSNTLQKKGLIIFFFPKRFNGKIQSISATIFNA
jgi:hypothetical protein